MVTIKASQIEKPCKKLRSFMELVAVEVPTSGMTCPAQRFELLPIRAAMLLARQPRELVTNQLVEALAACGRDLARRRERLFVDR
jgi:hypothetical protein